MPSSSVYFKFIQPNLYKFSPSFKPSIQLLKKSESPATYLLILNSAAEGPPPWRQAVDSVFKRRLKTID